MIDLSFLTEAEQEAILRVLNRDAELKKAEEERVQHLYDVVDDEQELKYKSGQWFYEAKSKRHRDKIHGTDLVRASMRKRKAPPPTLAELSRNYKENSSKKSWASSVNKDVFIPPELYGVLEDPEEEQGGFVPVKAEATQSSKRVSFLSTDKNMESLKNENVSPSRQRRNPFNSTNEVEDETEHQKDTQNQVPVNDTDGEDKDPYPDVLPSKVKFGVKLPYPAPGEIVRLSSSSRKASLTNGGDIPIPKPRTIPLKKTDSLDQSASDLKREDSFGSTGKPKSILKRRSSSSSTDSESIRMSQKADMNKIVLPTPILQVGKNHVSAEPVDESPENSLDRSKQVRFSANVHQNPPSPGADALDGKEIDEFEILDPNVSQTQLVNPVHASSEDSLLVTNPSSGLVLDMLKKTMYRKGSVEIPGLNGASVEGPSLSTKSASLNEDLHNITENSFVQETKPEISLALEANVSSDNDPIYAMVKKPTELLSSGLSQDKKPESESPDVSKPNSVEPKQGKPPVIGRPGNPDSLNPDKHAIEIMKAQDQSITKVLDWLNKSSESGGNDPIFLENKPASSENSFLPIHKRDEDNKVPLETLASGNTTSSLQQKSPSYNLPVSFVTAPLCTSNKVVSTRDEGNVELTPLENLEFIQQAEDHIQNSTAEPLVFGISKGGFGKIHVAEYMESQQKEDAKSPARLSSLMQKDTVQIDENGVQQTLVPVLIQGQASADKPSEMLRKNSSGFLENGESLSPINTGLSEALGEPLLFGYSKGGNGKIQSPLMIELGDMANIVENTDNLDSTNLENQVTSIIRDEQTKNKITGSDHVLQEQLIAENALAPCSYQSETENNNDKPSAKTNNDLWTQASIKYVPGTMKAVHIFRENSNKTTGESLNLGEGKNWPAIDSGEKDTAEFPQDAENTDTGNQVDEVTLANHQGESVQESGSKINNLEHKNINEVKRFWEKGEKEINGQSEMKRSVLKDVDVLGSQIHVKESIAAFSQKSSSFESDEGHPGIITFRRVILDEETLPSIAQLKTFWEQERNKLERRPRKEATESETGQSGIKTTFATPPLNFDKMEKRKKSRKRHTFHCFFESDQDSVPKHDYLARGISLNDGSDDLDKKYHSAAFQSLRSFWDAGKNTRDDVTLPPTGKNLGPLTMQPATSIDLQNGPDSMAFQEKSGQMSNLSDEQPSLLCHTDTNNTDILNKSQAEINPDYPNPQTSSSQEPVSETIVKTVAPSKVEFHFSERLKKLKTEILEDDLDFGSVAHPTCESIPQGRMISEHFSQDTKKIEMRDQDTEMLKLGQNPDQKRFKNSQSNIVEESDTICNIPTSEIFIPTKEQIEEGINSPISDLKENNTSLKEDTSYQTECSAPASEESAYATQEEFLSSSERVPPEGRSFNNELENSGNDLEKRIERDPPQEVYEGVEKTFLKRTPHDLKSSLDKLVRESVSPAEGQLLPSIDTEKLSVSSRPLGPLNFKDLSMPEKQSKKEIIEKIDNPVIRSRPVSTNFDTGLAKLYRESLDLDPSALEASAQNPVSDESLSAQNSPFINDPELHDQASPEESISSDSMYSDALSEVINTVKRTAVQRRAFFANDLQKSQEVVSDAEDLIGGSHSKPFIQTASVAVRLNTYNRNMNEQEVHADSSAKGGPTTTAFSVSQEKATTARDNPKEEGADDYTVDPHQLVKQSTPLKERNSSLRKSTMQLYLEAPYRRDLSKSIDFELTGYLTDEAGHQKYPDNSSIPKEDKDHTYEEVRAAEASLERSHFSDPEKLKRLSQSVPSFLNDDTDGRETDSASENSFQLGRHKKSPSSLTNLSGSSGMASLSSVSGSVMSIYSGDFGNVDIKGNIQFALDYADNLQEFQVFVSQCKDLAAADVKKQRSDPYVKAYLLPEKAKMGKRKTGVKKKNLNPVYNDVLRYKITKNALLSQTLNISVWHYDVLGRNSFLGEVEVNLGSWDWSNKQMNWYPLQPRTPAAGIGLENRGEMKLAIKYVPEAFKSAKNAGTGEVHIWLKECSNLPMLRGNKINSFIKCTILPDTSRKSRQKTRTVDKTPNPYFNHTMVYDGFKKEDLRDACVELTVWDHNKLTNHFLGGLRIGLGTGKSYGTSVDWMDSNAAEATTWDKMIGSPDTWVEAILPLRMLKMAKLAK